MNGGGLMNLPGVSRGDIMALQEAMVAEATRIDPDFVPGNTDKICPVKHHFAPGLYAREIFLPAGTRIIGKIHRHAHVNTISRGRVLVFTEFGCMELKPCTFVSQPGTKRVVAALEDTVWVTYHPTNSTDLAEIEKEIIAPSFEALEAPKG